MDALFDNIAKEYVLSFEDMGGRARSIFIIVLIKQLDLKLDRL